MYFRSYFQGLYTIEKYQVNRGEGNEAFGYPVFVCVWYVFCVSPPEQGFCLYVCVFQMGGKVSVCMSVCVFHLGGKVSVCIYKVSVCMYVCM